MLKPRTLAVIFVSIARSVQSQAKRVLKPRTLAIIFVLVFLVLLVAGIGIGDLEENLFNGSML